MQFCSQLVSYAFISYKLESTLSLCSILCTYFALFSCTLLNGKLVFPTLFIHHHISYYYSYITTHHPLSHHPPHRLLSHHLLYNPHTRTLYSQPLKKTAADCQNVWFNNTSWLVNCTELKSVIMLLYNTIMLAVSVPLGLTQPVFATVSV